MKKHLWLVLRRLDLNTVDLGLSVPLKQIFLHIKVLGCLAAELSPSQHTAPIPNIISFWAALTSSISLGNGIIDFEQWRPVYRQNFGNLTDYKTVSIALEKKKHPFWPSKWIEKEAIFRFEQAARDFMETTLMVAKFLRPNATWGYYAYPYCFNMSPNNMKRQCPKEVIAENDRYLCYYLIHSDI